MQSAESPTVTSDGCTRQTGVVRSATWRRMDTICLLLVCLVALTLRMTYLQQVCSSPLFKHPILDAELHDRWARAIADGVTFFPNGPLFKAPLYPIFLSWIYRFIGDGYLAARLVQILFGTASCALLFLTGRHAFGRLVGLLAGFAAATYWTFIYFDAELQLESLSVFLNLLGLWLILKSAGGPRAWPWLLTGLVLGLATINRPNVLIFLPAVALWMLIHMRREMRAATWRAALFTIGCALPILPITIRNFVIGGDLVLIAWQGGANFYIGNNPESDGYTARMPGARQSWWGGYHDWIAIAEQDIGRTMMPSEVSDYYYKKAWRFIIEQPVVALNKTLVKLQLYFWHVEITNNKSLYYFTERFTPITRWLPLSFGVLAPLGLVGMWLRRREAGRLFPLWGFFWIYTASVVAFFVCARFRVPAVPVLMLFAADAVVTCGSAVRARRWSDAGAVAIGALILALLINRGYTDDQTWRFAYNQPHSRWQVASAFFADGRLDKAMSEFEAILEDHPDYAPAEAGLGEAHRRTGDCHAAERHLRRALELDPQSGVHASLADCLLRDGRWHATAELLRQGAQAMPGNTEIRMRLAWLRAIAPDATVRDAGSALRIAEAVLAGKGPRVEVLDTLAVTYAAAGRYPDALSAARQARDLAAQQKNTPLEADISRRIALYERGQPCREWPIWLAR